MTKAAAFFDIDGTLLKANVVDYYLYLASQEKSPMQRRALKLQLLIKAPYYLLLDRWSRDRFNRQFYRNYRGMQLQQCQQWSRSQFVEKIRPALFPSALACIAQHQAAGRAIILVTGSLDFIVAPLAEFIGADEMIVARLATAQGRFTGEMVSAPVAGAEKARGMVAVAQAKEIDLTASYAYADSMADLPMLTAVGHPVAVNPDQRLQRLAQQRNWEIARWKFNPILNPGREVQSSC